MTKAPRLRVVLVALLMTLPALLVLGLPAASAGSYDRSLNAQECDLVGRAYVRGAGCSRTRCVPGARLYRKTYGAEACQLRRQGSFGFISTIDYRRCAALGRRWLADVNYCASYPDRSAAAVYDAPQCTGARSVYVLLTEADGFYDECLTPARVDELVAYARGAGSDLGTEASLRSSVQCDYRPAMSYVDGRCVSDPASRPDQGGVLLVGDSMTWRGTDELGRLRPSFALDGEPARQLSALRARLGAYREGSGTPTGFILELGTVPPPPSFGKRDLASVLRTLPDSTRIMFVLPFTEAGRNWVRVGGWMRSIARSRGNSCIADWPRFAASRPGLLQDGIHVAKRHEVTWARWISQQWSRC